MAAKTSIDALLRKHLGAETAKAFSAKIDKMVAKGATAAQVEKTITDDLVTHIEKEVTAAVIQKIDPITPIKVKPISVDVKSKITPIVISPRISTGVEVKVTPPIRSRGSR